MCLNLFSSFCKHIMNCPLNKHQYKHSSIFTTSKSRMADVLNLAYLPKIAMEISLRIDCELAYTYV